VITGVQTAAFDARRHGLNAIDDDPKERNLNAIADGTKTGEFILHRL
jgi:hypothetical protein